MTRGNRFLVLAIFSIIATAQLVSAAPLTMNFNVGTGGPDSLSGTIGGTLKAQATSGSIIANFTDVDIDTNLLDFSNRTGNVSLAVNTAATPGIVRALSARTERMRACATWLRSIAACSMPSRWTSSTN